MKILHVADIHSRDKDIEEAEKCCDFMVDTAEKEKVDLTAIAGDCFDSRDIKLDSRAAKLIIRTVSRLADIAPVAVIVGTASHDGTAPEILEYARGRFPVYVGITPQLIDLPNAVVTLVPQPTKQFFNQGDIQTSNEAIAHGMAGLFAGFGAQAAERGPVPHILVGHWNVSGSKLPTGQTLTGQDIDISVDQMMLADPDLICLGHIHMRQQLGDRTFYPGSPFPLNWGENTEHGFYIHTLRGRKLVSSEFIQTPCKKLCRVSADYTKEPMPEQCEDFAHQLVSEIVSRECENAFVRCDFTVWQDEAGLIPKDAIKQLYLDAGALDVDIKINAVPRETIRAAAVLEAETLKDEFAEMAKLRGEEIDPETLSLAEQLETVPAEELLKTIAEAA